MKTMDKFYRTAQLFLALALLILPTLSHAAVMNDYCVVPPFVGENVPSNLLLLLDNSSSMYDLSYSDQGNTDTIGNITRQPYYCYDETYQAGNVYAGYFGSAVYYTYDFTNKYFTTTASMPATCGALSITNALCVGVDATNQVNYFTALGNYLNWLTASKFDVEKQILTGGKVVGKLCSGTDRSCNSVDDCVSGQSCDPVVNNSAQVYTFVQAETRGCLGQAFIKNPLYTDFVNFTGSTDPNQANKLLLTFAIRGPVNPNNASAPSSGGQTYIDVYSGTYNNQACQTAVTDYYGSVSLSTLQNDIQACLNFDPKNYNYCAQDYARAYVASCTIDNDCIVQTGTPHAGKCTNPIGKACFDDTDCSLYTPGKCTNDATRSCTADPDCTVTQVSGGCTSGAYNAISCLHDADCGSNITTLGGCSNVSRSCSADTDCKVTQVTGGCSNGSAIVCSNDNDCTVATAVGGCSDDGAKICTVDAICANTSSCTNKDKNGALIACTSNANCNEGVIAAGNCNNTFTSGTGPSCASDAACSGYLKYLSGKCSNNALLSCTVNSDCTYASSAGGCTRTGSTCTADATCAGSSTCTNTDKNGAQIACSSSTNCAEGAITAGKCNNAATSGTGATCSSNADCSSYLQYRGGTCSNKYNGGGSITCTTNSDCASGVNLAGQCNNVTSGAGATCKSNADCSAYVVPMSGKCTQIHGTVYDPCTTALDCGIASDPVGGPYKYGTCSAPAPTVSTCTRVLPDPSTSGTCSGPAATCTAVLPNPTTSGSCAPNTCNSPAPVISTGSCGNGTASTCSGPLPNPPTSGSCVANTCSNPPPGISTGTCTNPTPVAPSTGTCTQPDPVVTVYTCTNPPSVLPSTGTCTAPGPQTNTIGTCTAPAPIVYSTDYGPCINPSHSGAVKAKIAFSETIQTCWTYLNCVAAGHTPESCIQTGDYNRLLNLNNNGKCDTVYNAGRVCTGDTTKGCTSDTNCSSKGLGTCTYTGWGVCSGNNAIGCSIDNDCSTLGLGLCKHGPATILPGNPALICGNAYLGQFCRYPANPAPGDYWNSTMPDTQCTWDTSDEALIKSIYASFCNAQQPTVIDPSDSTASSANYEQLPSLLGGIGAQAQLGSPIGSFPVRLKIDAESPTGLIQQYATRLRIGAMSFDFNGSKTEAASGATIKLPRVCSNDPTLMCNQDADCGSGNTCLSTSSSAGHNQDGGQVKYGSYVGEGKCATMTQQTCTTDTNCSGGNKCINGFCGIDQGTRCATDSVCAGDTCMANGAGDHLTKGLINAIDSIRANAWTPFAEAYYNAIGYFARTSSGSSRTDLRLNSTPIADFDETLNPSQYKCQQNYVMLITDGSSTADQNASVKTLAGTFSSAAIPGGGTAPIDWNSTCSYFAGSSYLPIMSWLAKNRNIADFTTAPKYGRDNITTYVVSTGNNSNGLASADECNPMKLLADTAANGGTTLKQANNPQQLYSSLQAVFQELAARSASGTAASILSNSEGSGANILQAIFFPRKIFDNDTQTFWLGEMNSLWYYIDPFIGNSSMREDTNGDNALELTQDNVIQFYFDQVAGQTKVNLWQDTNGDGSGDTPVASGISADLLKSLWKAGKQLWERDLTVSPRTIYTPSGTGLMNFSSDTATATALQANLQAADVATAQNLIRYVHGFDYPEYTTLWRPRTVQIGSIPAATVSAVATDPYVTNPRDKGIGVWKLGDIISSTPRTQSSVRQNAYNLSAPNGYTDASYGKDAALKGYIYTKLGYTSSDGRTIPAYNSRGMVYVGANDGMLHAFKLGLLNVAPSGDKKAELTDITGIGNEIWAFIPTNVLPYLNYYADPNYSHLYFMDGSTKVVDASVGGCSSTNYWDCDKDTTSGNGTNWRTILVGGMGIGGASRNKDDACEDRFKYGGTCVKTPIDGVGYSSYYGLDVSDPNGPRFLWEFSDGAIAADSPADKGLGFATSGAAIVRISAQDAGNNPDKTKNGRWFAVFGSGPTGPIDTSANHRFMGTSNQPLKVYVVDLKATPPFRKGVNYWVIGDVYDGATKTSLLNAFAGSLVNGNLDADKWNSTAPGNYQDDAVYFGYTQKTGDNGPWNSGGVLRLVTFEDLNPDHWKLVKVFDGVGPVTSAIARLQDPKNHHLWLFFGTGRYYYMQDDFDTARQLFGIKDACYMINDTLDPNCAVKHTSGEEVDETSPNATTNDVGWSITLRGKNTTNPDNIFGAERNISDPTALTNGAVFFTTYKPNKDLCQYGGRTYMWGVKWDTGTRAGASSLKGKALVQVSTGEFKQLDLSTVLDDMDGRAMGDPGMTGKGSNDSSVFISNSNNKPVKRIMHIQEH